jgi:hypothetical protein
MTASSPSVCCLVGSSVDAKPAWEKKLYEYVKVIFLSSPYLKFNT